MLMTQFIVIRGTIELKGEIITGNTEVLEEISTAT